MKLSHTSAVCSSLENADRFYEGILGLSKVKEFSLDKDLTHKIFDIECDCQIIVYSKENLSVEVFVPGINLEKGAPKLDHLCIEVEDKEKFLKKCEAEGLVVKRIPKGDKELYFVKDYDDNLFEIKEVEQERIAR